MVNCESWGRLGVVDKKPCYFLLQGYWLVKYNHVKFIYIVKEEILNWGISLMNGGFHSNL